MKNSCSLNHPEEISADLYITCSPELLTDLERVPSLGFCVFKPTLQAPNAGLHNRYMTEPVCIINIVRLDSLDMSACIVELTFVNSSAR